MIECKACDGLGIQTDQYICWDCGGSGEVKEPIRLCVCGSLICPSYDPVPYLYFVNCAACGAPGPEVTSILGWPICSTCYMEYPMAELDLIVRAHKGQPNPLHEGSGVK
jgi:hypothetical protein